MKRLLPLTFCLLLLACSPATGGTGGDSSSSPAPDVILEFPEEGETVSSPLLVKGVATGTWFFEASFPIKLVDENGVELDEVAAQAQGEWMTTDYVPFEATLTFETTAKTGTLILSKDNPSGLPENDESIRIPVKF